MNMKNRKFQQAVSMVLAVCISASLMSVPAFAEGSGQDGTPGTVVESTTSAAASFTTTKWAKGGVDASATSDGITVTLDQENDENVVSLSASSKVYVATATVTIPAGYSATCR